MKPIDKTLESQELHLAQIPEQLTGTERGDQGISEETQEAVKALSLEDQYVLTQRGELKYEKPEGLEELDTEEPWKVLAPRPRMFQEAFCRPPFVVHEKRKATDKAENDAVIDYAFISPVRYPDKLMEHIAGITCAYANTAQEGMKERFEKFPYLRIIFKNLKPVCDSNLEPLKDNEESGRISILPRQLGELEEIPNVKKWPRGAIIVSNNPRRKEGPKRHFSFYDNFYEFLRSLKHTLNNYSGRYNIKDLDKRSEFEVLNQLRADIRAAIDTLQTWTRLSADQKEQVQQLIGELKQLLHGVKDQYKIFAKEHLDDAKSLKERQLPKYNPGCTCAKLVGAFNDIMSRFENCVGIEHSVGKSLKNLEKTQHAAEGEFKQLDSDMDFLLEDEYFKKNRFLGDPDAVAYVLESSEEIAKHLEQGMIAKLQALIDNDSLPAPYPQWAETVLQNLKAAQIIIKRIGQMDEEEVKALGAVGLERVHEEAMKNIIRTDLTLRCVTAQQELSKIVNEILSRPWDFDPISLYDEVDDIHREVDPHAFREHYDVGDVGAKVLFKVKEVDQLSMYCRDLKHMLKIWRREKIRLYDEVLEYQRTYQDVPTEVYLENLSGFEDRKIDLDVAHLNAIYEDIKAYDFEGLFEALGNHITKIQHAKRTTMAYRFLENMNLYPKTVEDTPAAGE